MTITERDKKGKIIKSVGGIYRFPKGNKMQLGKIPWNKGKRGIYSDETLRKMRDKRIGKKPSIKTREKMGNAHRGEKSYRWKGGISPENVKIRNSFEMKIWRKAVFVRDNFTCQKYGTRGGELHPHHINNFADFPELRFAIDNGITLSKKAHDEFHKIYGKKNNTREQLLEFLNL